MPRSKHRWSMRQPIKPCLYGLILLIQLALAQAGFARPLVILSDDTLSYMEVFEALGQYSGRKLDYVIAGQLEKKDGAHMVSDRDYVVAVGAKATSVALTHGLGSTVIATFIPRRSYEELITHHSNNRLIQQQRISALYLDQPYQRQLRMARILAPAAQVMATAFSELSAEELPRLREAADKTGFKLIHSTLSSDENPIKKLQPLIEQSDLFLALPDQAIFNRTTAKWILYITLRQRVPLLGFSLKYVEAGATAGVYSTPAQIGQETGEILRKMLDQDTALPSPAYPRYFSVATNPAAARTLRIRLPEAAEIEAQLKKLEEQE